MSNKLLLPCNLICGYFDSAAFGTIKETPKRTCTMFEFEYFLEEGKNIFLNGNTYHVKKTEFISARRVMFETANFGVKDITLIQRAKIPSQ